MPNQILFIIALLTICLCQSATAAGKKYGQPRAPPLWKKWGLANFDWEELMYLTSKETEKHAKSLALIRKDAPNHCYELIAFQHTRNALEVAILYREVLESIMLEVENLLEQYAGMPCDGGKPSNNNNSLNNEQQQILAAAMQDPVFMSRYANNDRFPEAMCKYIKDLKDARKLIQSDFALIEEASNGKAGLADAYIKMMNHRGNGGSIISIKFESKLSGRYKRIQQKAEEKERSFAPMHMESTVRYKPSASGSSHDGGQFFGSNEQNVITSRQRARALELHMRPDGPQFLPQPHPHPQQPPQYMAIPPQQQFVESDSAIIQRQQVALMQQQQVALMQQQQQQLQQQPAHMQQQQPQPFIQSAGGQGPLSRRLSQQLLDRVASNGQHQQHYHQLG